MPENFTYTYRVTTRDINESPVKKSELNSNSLQLHMASDHIPAFEKEPYMPTFKKYLFEIEFELSAIKFPNKAKTYASSWESIDRKLFHHESFGQELRKDFITEDVDAIVSGITSQKDRMLAIYNYVQNSIVWNGDYGIYVSESLRKNLKNKSGTASDINLLLTLMLKKAGLDASPVIISTKSNGMVNTNQPGLNQFNYTICNVEIGGESFNLDATDPYCEPNFLPLRCVNGQGRIIRETNSEWIDLEPNFSSRNVIGGSFIIDENGTLNGKLKKNANNYYAYSLKKELDKYKSTDEYIEEYQNKNHIIEVIDYEFDSIQSIKQLKSTYEVSITNQLERFNNLILITPLNIYSEVENPFKAETRNFPIYFQYPSENIYVMNYKIPEGYQIDKLPESINLSTPDKSLNFLYSIRVNAGYINVTCKKRINKTLFLPTDYINIKNFYNQMISKQNEKIILKKTS